MAGTDGRSKFANINRENQLDPLNFRNAIVRSMNWFNLASGSIGTVYTTELGRNFDRSTSSAADQFWPTALQLYPYFVQKAGREVGSRLQFSIRNSSTGAANIFFNQTPATLRGYRIVGRTDQYGAVSVPQGQVYDFTLELKEVPTTSSTNSTLIFDVSWTSESATGGGGNATSGQAFMTYMTNTQSRGLGWREVRTVGGGGPYYTLRHDDILTDAAAVPSAPLYVNSDLQGVINNTTDADFGIVPESASLLARFSNGIAFTGNQITGTIYSYEYTQGSANPVVTSLGTATFNAPATNGTTQILTIPVSAAFTDYFVGANVKIAAEFTIPIQTTGTIEIIGVCWAINYNYPG